MSVVALVLELIRLSLPIAQQLVDAVNLEMALSGSGHTPSEDELRQLDAALIAAHEALQNAQQGTPA